MTDSADVVVVGSGGAGLLAAVTAADRGASVTLLERSDRFGGTTGFSGGKIWVPCSRHQREAGLDDSLSDARVYLERAIGSAYPHMANEYLARAPEMVEYVESRTPLRFYCCRNYPDYHPEWPGARAGGRALDARAFDASVLGELASVVRRSPTFLPFTQEEWEKWRSVIDFDWALIARRIEQQVYTMGAAIVAGLLRACQQRGIDLRLRHRAVALQRDDSGRISAVTVRVDDRIEVELGCRWGAILTSGGFEWNDALRAHHVTAPLEAAASPPGNEGDGLIMALEHGALGANLSEAWWMPLVQVPGEEVDGRPLSRALITERGLPGSIIVNRAGCRFANEAQNYNDLSRSFHARDPVTYDRPNLPAWLIFDSRFRGRYSIATVMPGEPLPDWVAAADSLHDLAHIIGVDPPGLTRTLARFNHLAASGRDADFGRGESAYDRYYGDPRVAPNANLAPLDVPPFHAIRVIPGTIGTKGGLVTDERGRVLSVRGQPIPGLFAAGNLASFWLGGGYPGAGASLGPALTFGHIAGLTIAPAEAS
jgi:3-oxosteroid 1-dehydrogenase